MPNRYEGTPDLAAQTGDALVAIGDDGRLLSMNPMAERFLRVQEDAAVGRMCRDVLRSSLCESACPLETGKYATHFNVKMRPGGEEEIPVCIVCTPLRDGRGRTTGVVESIRDVRQVVRLIEERDEAVAWWRAIADTVNDGLIATDREIRITGFNRAAEYITGYKREEVLGRSCKEVLSTGFCPLEETLV
jgi:PAS domain-containing protein